MQLWFAIFCTSIPTGYLSVLLIRLGFLAFVDDNLFGSFKVRPV